MAHIISITLLLSCAAFALAAPKEGIEPRIIWQDEFDTLDEGRWKHLVTAWRGGNDEFQYYRNNRKNSFVQNGILHIRPTPVSEELSDDQIRHGTIQEPGCNMEPCVSVGGQGDTVLPIFSARLMTQGIYAPRYGRIEFRAKMPRGDWIWPALWMYPDNEVYGGWPRSGEIDIVESRGNRPGQLTLPSGQSIGVDLAGSTMHWGPDYYNNRFMMTHWESNGPDLSDDFHTYELEWTDTHMIYRIDGREIGSVYPPEGGFWQLGGFQGDNPWRNGGRMAPFDQPFYLMMNVAVGGRFFPDDARTPNGRPWDWNSGHPLQQFYESQNVWKPTWDRDSLQVDYVRVYEV